MKNVLVSCLALLMVLVAVTAFAADNAVPSANVVASLGLSGMQQVSDEQGMQVRGTSFSATGSAGGFAMFYVTDNANSFYTQSANAFQTATTEDTTLTLVPQQAFTVAGQFTSFTKVFGDSAANPGGITFSLTALPPATAAGFTAGFSFNTPAAP